MRCPVLVVEHAAPQHVQGTCVADGVRQDGPERVPSVGAPLRFGPHHTGQVPVRSAKPASAAMLCASWVAPP
eukprot:11126085-Alexandrium_andersonii.AAC.1